MPVELYDPTPMIEREPPSPSSQAVILQDLGENFFVVGFRGVEFTAKGIGPDFAVGDYCSFIQLDLSNWVIKAEYQYQTRWRKPLYFWSDYAPASLFLRLILEGNPKWYMYSEGISSVPVSDNVLRVHGPNGTVDLPVEFAGELQDATGIEAGQPVLLYQKFPNYWVVVYTPSQRMEITGYDNGAYEGQFVEFSINIDAIPEDFSISFDYHTQDGTAHSGSDYQATSGTLTWTPEDTEIEKKIRVQTYSDYPVDPGEFFELLLTNPKSCRILTERLYGTIHERRKDPDDPSKEINPIVNLVADVTGFEGTALTFRVSIVEKDPGVGVTIQYHTAGITATEGVDYVGKSGTLTWTPEEGNTEKEIVIQTIDDSTPELFETFNVILSLPNNCILGTKPTAIGTITDEHQDPLVHPELVTHVYAFSAESLWLLVNPKYLGPGQPNPPTGPVNWSTWDFHWTPGGGNTSYHWQNTLELISLALGHPADYFISGGSAGGSGGISASGPIGSQFYYMTGGAGSGVGTIGVNIPRYGTPIFNSATIWI